MLVVHWNKLYRQTTLETKIGKTLVGNDLDCVKQCICRLDFNFLEATFEIF